MSIITRANGKTPRWQKIDDFASSCKNPRAGLVGGGEDILEKVGCEDTRRSSGPSQCKAGEGRKPGRRRRRRGKRWQKGGFMRRRVLQLAHNSSRSLKRY